MEIKNLRCAVCDAFLEVDMSGEYVSPCENCLNQLYEENSDTMTEEKWTQYTQSYYDEGYDAGYKVGFQDCESAIEESCEDSTDLKDSD